MKNTVKLMKICFGGKTDCIFPNRFFVSIYDLSGGCVCSIFFNGLSMDGLFTSFNYNSNQL